MRAGPAGGVVASAIFGVALLVARTLAAKIERNPDPFPLERLAREPDGAEVCIARPDGTVLRALVAGKGPTAVLAHGYGGSVAAWNIVWDALVARAAQFGKCPSPAMISVFLEAFVRQDHKALLPILRALEREDRYPRLGEITVPTVVMVGSADRATPSGHSRRLAAGIPGARLITVSGAGHILGWEAPDALVQVVASFQD
jgi:alpha/beta hydrolase fold